MRETSAKFSKMRGELYVDEEKVKKSNEALG